MTTQSIAVLHVDDEPSFADTAAAFLERVNDRIAVETATSTDDARSILDDQDIDCIVSDYDMPGENGIEFLECIRESHPDLPFILYTGKGSEAVASEAISAGVTDYMGKETGTDQYTVLANRIANAVDQYRAEQDAERTHQRLEELTQSTTDCRWMFSADWEELLFISGYEAIWGRPTEAIEENPRDFLEGIHPEDREFVERSMTQLSNGEQFDIEYRILRGDDSTGWVWAKGEPIYEDGEVVRIVGLTRDITERKQRTHKLERTREHVSFILESIDASIWELNLDTGSINCFPDVCPVLNAEITAIDDVFGRIVPVDRAQLEQAAEESSDTDEAVSAIVQPIADVDAEWVEVRGRRVADDASNTKLIGLTRDVTESKRRAQELAEVNDRLELALEAADLGVYDWDVQANELTADGNVVELLGFEPGEFEVTLSSWKDRAHPEDLSDVTENIQPLCTGDAEYSRSEYRVRTKHDTWAWIQTVGKVVERTDDGEPARIIGVHRDITSRKERELDLQQERDRLDEFASIVSHDLRNPLNVVVGRLEFVREETESEHFEPIFEALDRMERIIDDVFWLAQNGEDIGETESVDLRPTCEAAWATVVDESTNAKLVLPDDEHDTLGVVEGDYDQLRHLIENLFRNAVDHAGPEVTVRVERTETGFAIEDDGPGIDPENHHRVFDTGYSTSDSGMGIGLRIVEQVATGHGWDVQLGESTTGGARFEITAVEVPGSGPEPVTDA